VKFKPGLVAVYTIHPGNGMSLVCSCLGPAQAIELHGLLSTAEYHPQYVPWRLVLFDYLLLGKSVNSLMTVLKCVSSRFCGDVRKPWNNAMIVMCWLDTETVH